MALSLHHPFIPITSGWFLSPIIIIFSFLSKASLTMLCIFFTKGHVASIKSISLSSRRSCSHFLIPWLRIITVSPFSASSGESIIRTPFSSKLFTTEPLWIIGPRVTIFLPFSMPFCVISTARLTPKQKPAFWAILIVFSANAFHRPEGINIFHKLICKLLHNFTILCLFCKVSV